MVQPATLTVLAAYSARARLRRSLTSRAATPGSKTYSKHDRPSRARVLRGSRPAAITGAGVRLRERVRRHVWDRERG